jgi:hypothetical protein
VTWNGIQKFEPLLSNISKWHINDEEFEKCRQYTLGLGAKGVSNQEIQAALKAIQTTTIKGSAR